MANVRQWSRTAAIEVYLQFEIVIFGLKKNLYPFPLVKAKLNMRFLTNRSYGANMFILLNTRQYIGALYHLCVIKQCGADKEKNLEI
jgi:hypothetical protein